jgi:DNA-binding response OmpR family regulator
VAAKILLIEDDATIGASLSRALGAGGHKVEWAMTATEAKKASSGSPDLVLLDLGLPDGDGIDLCRELVAETPGRPVIMLTARSEEIDVVVGLGAGAVDYITKPFRLAELMARVEAHLRFAGVQDADRITVGDVVVDRASRRVWAAEIEVALRAREFDLLNRLMADAGKVVTRDTLMSDVWNENWFGSTKTLDVHVAAIRRKLGEQPGEPSRITSVRGIGYRFEEAAASPVGRPAPTLP